LLIGIARDIKNRTSSAGAAYAQLTLAALEASNTAESPSFQPTVFQLWDNENLSPFTKRLLGPYISWAQNVIRHPTDVVMLNHILLYFSTSVPSAILLFWHFTWIHGFGHWLLSAYYVGAYTLMKHQHIHQGGVLSKRWPWSWVDAVFPYVLDPLIGHTWNSYYYHHVKHHHVEGNGPDDLSSTIRYQRDDIFNLLHYVGRFYFLIWFDLPGYFIQKKQYKSAAKAAFWEISNILIIFALARWRFLPTFFTLILPLLVLRLGLMLGNWGQHAFVDEVEPDSDFRSSITLLDISSNRFCFNDGYHTSHHLNPRRHWRDHPVAFMKQKVKYADERALVFSDIDYLMVTVRLMMKDYEHLAKKLVPMGDQIDMSFEERVAMLKRKTRKFTEEEVKMKFSLG
jgi:hypothetical protein